MRDILLSSILRKRLIEIRKCRSKKYSKPRRFGAAIAVKLVVSKDIANATYAERPAQWIAIAINARTERMKISTMKSESRTNVLAILAGLGDCYY